MVSAMSQNHTVLLIDDDRDIRAALSAMLADEGFEVLAAPDGYDALASLDNVNPDIIILDWMMPVVDGGKFVRALRTEYHRTTPVLVITAGRTSRTQALAAGADDFLEKPFELGDLIDRVHHLTERETSRA
jgi:DNA-binding response OmpR family regulator